MRNKNTFRLEEWYVKKRKIVLSIMITVCTMFCLCGCSQKEPSVVRTYEKTDSKEAFENTEPVIMVKHYEMSDGTTRTEIILTRRQDWRDFW